jgi:hypothetical protein
MLMGLSYSDLYKRAFLFCALAICYACFNIWLFLIILLGISFAYVLYYSYLKTALSLFFIIICVLCLTGYLPMAYGFLVFMGGICDSLATYYEKRGD